MITSNIKNDVKIYHNLLQVKNIFNGGGVLDYDIPDSYVELEYIQDGDNIIVKTDIISQNNYKLVADFEVVPKTIEGDIKCIGFGFGKLNDTCQYCEIKDGELVENYIKFNDNIQNIKWNERIKYEDEIKLDYTNEYQFIIGGNTDYSYTNRQNKIYIKHYNYQLYNENNICICNLIPVRRLGDSICGMFDTINQKFYSSDTQYQFIGGNIKLISNELLNISEDFTLYEYFKELKYNRNPKSFISNAINSGYLSNRQYLSNLNVSDTSIEPYNSTNKNEYDLYHFNRKWFNTFGTNAQHIQNINPTWNIIKQNLSSSDFTEDNNSLIYLQNRTQEETLTIPAFNVYEPDTTTPSNTDGFLDSSYGDGLLLNNLINSTEYQILEYIENDNNDYKYIDTGIYLSNILQDNDEWVFGAYVEPYYLKSTEYQTSYNETTLVHDRLSDNNIFTNILIFISNYYIQFKFADINNNNNVFTIKNKNEKLFPKDKIIKIEMNYQGCSVNNHYYSFSSKKTTAKKSTKCNSFKIGYDASYANNKKRKYYGKIYRIYIKINNKYLINLYPAKRLSDEVCGLYDVINDKFYKSATTYNYTGKEFSDQS